MFIAGFSSDIPAKKVTKRKAPKDDADDEWLPCEFHRIIVVLLFDNYRTM
jgi:hypothetical protein